MTNIAFSRIKDLGILCEKILNDELDFFESNITDYYDFEKVISKFKKIKETTIRKSMTDNIHFKLYFNVDDNKNMLWDILFLGKYIDKTISNQTEKEEILNRIHTVILEELKKYDEANISLKNSFDELKKSVVILQKVRDAFSHNEDGKVYSFDINNHTISINSTHQNNKLTCTIPIQYIDSIGLGIKPLEEDVEIANEVTQLVNIISEHQEYKVNDLPSLFYRISPNQLSYLLDKCNNDLNQVENLPSGLLTCNLDILKYLLDDIGLNIENIKNYRFELLNCEISRLNYLYFIYGDFNKINDLPNTLFNCSNEMLEYLLNKFGKENLFKLSENIITSDIERIEKLYYLCNNDLEKLNTLKLAFFKCPSDNLNYLLKNIEIEKLNQFKEPFFYIPISNINFFLNNFNDVNIINSIHKSILNSSLENLNLLFQKSGNNVENFLKLSPELFENTKNIPYFLNYDFDTLCIIKDAIFKSNLETLEFLLNYVGGDVNKLNELPDNCFTMEPNNLQFLLSKVNNDIYMLSNFSPALFSCNEKRLKLIFDKINNKMNSLYDIIAEIFEEDLFSEEVIERLFEDEDEFLSGLALNDCRDSERFDDVINLIYFDNNSYKYLYNICRLTKTKICELLKINKELILFSVDDIRKVLMLSDGDTEILKYSSISLTKCNKQRFDNIFKRINYDYSKLSEVPKELFECNEEVFEQLYEIYEFNVLKTFLKTNNPKLIALTIYMNQFFSVFKNEIDDLTSIDILDTTMFDIKICTPVLADLANSLNSGISTNLSSKTFNILKSINVANKTSETYLETIIRFLDNLKDFDSNLHKQNRNIITSIRNCCEHMLIDIDPNDLESVVLEDSIIKNGVREVSFKATVKMKDLIRFVKNLENNIKDGIYSESIEHKSKLMDKSLYESKKEAFMKIKDIVIKKYQALYYLNSQGIMDVRECEIDGQIYFIYQVKGKKVQTKIDDLSLLYYNLEKSASIDLDKALTPRIFK